MTTEIQTALRRHTDVVVSGIAIVAVLILAWGVLPWLWLRGVSIVLLAWEVWTLVNRFRDDTITQATIRVSHDFPLLVLGAGVGLGYGIAKGYLDLLSLSLGILAGHFWFSSRYDPHTEARLAADHMDKATGSDTPAA